MGAARARFGMDSHPNRGEGASEANYWDRVRKSKRFKIRQLEWRFVAATRTDTPSNLGFASYGASRLMSPMPWGLPQPVTKSNPVNAVYDPLLPMVMS
jgi:hypothetical protein